MKDGFAARWKSRGRASFAFLAFVALSLPVAACMLAAPAQAALTRMYEDQIPGAYGAIATDPLDNLWVSPAGAGEPIKKFDASGSLLDESEKLGDGTSIAYGSKAGLLYVISTGIGQIWALNPDGSPSGTAFSFPQTCCGTAFRIAVDNSAGGNGGDLYVVNSGYEGAGVQRDAVIRVDGAGVPKNFQSSQPYIPSFTPYEVLGTSEHPFAALTFNWDGTGAPTGGGIAVDQAGNFYVIDSENQEVDQFKSTGEFIRAYRGPFGDILSAVAVDPTNNHVLIADESGMVHEFDSSGTFLFDINGAETPAASFTPTGLAVDSTGRVSVADRANGVINVFGPAIIAPTVSYGKVSDTTTTSATINAVIDPDGGSSVQQCYLEYGTTKAYGSPHIPCTPDPATAPPTSNFSVPTAVSVDLEGLENYTTYHYRIVADNGSGLGVGADRTFVISPPTIDSTFASGVTASSADLHAQINPNEAETTYRFEYGITTAYGSSAPIPDGTLVADTKGQNVQVPLSGLQGGVYHFRVVAQNKFGTTVTSDETFTFFPPSCPNSVARQQTHAAYLPDCRAYELVSPANAGGASLIPGGPNTGHATSPSRLAFVGIFGIIPGAGDPINVRGDLYVSTRTDQGWVTRYIGPPANEVACAGGPPAVSWVAREDKLQNSVLTDLGMSRFLDWNGGNAQNGCGNNGGLFSDLNTASDEQVSNSPYVWRADGSSLGRWPTNLSSYADGTEALRCKGEYSEDLPRVVITPAHFGCTSAIAASPDLSHFVFSTASGAFGSEGVTSAPGSAYSNDTVNNNLSLISRTPGGEDIGQEPESGDPNEVIQFPEVSTDGSHILMSTATKPHCGPPLCRPPLKAVRLYMRVDDIVTYDVSGGNAVDFVDMTPNGKRVYFTTAERVTPDDSDSSADLYMWDEESKSISRVSVGGGLAGNNDDCDVSWIGGCGVMTYDDTSYSGLPGGKGGLGIGGYNETFTVRQGGLTDNSVAAKSGDIYFYSPEQLDGAKGFPNAFNFYRVHDGQIEYVTALDVERTCTPYPTPEATPYCSDGPIARLQVSPSGDFAAFITDSRLTDYDNGEFAMMYLYDAARDELTCVSCAPGGLPPTADVYGSQGGLFMTDDGRAFFSSDDSLVPQDTNESTDVYEYVEGRAQLITSGVSVGVDGSPFVSQQGPPGLYGVSANGTDVYFSTLETLVSQDLNGARLKFYNARTNGGFSVDQAVAPCRAADECRAPAGIAVGSMANGTAAPLAQEGKPRASKKRRKGKRKRVRADRHHGRSGRGKRDGSGLRGHMEGMR